MSMTLEPSQIVLSARAAGGKGATFDPVQIQHLLFLIDRQIPDWVDGPHFAFAPGPFGPFAGRAKEVFLNLYHAGHVNMQMAAIGSLYTLTSSGFAQGSNVLSRLEADVVTYLRDLFTWVDALDFRQRLAVLQMHFPDMVMGRHGATENLFRPDSARRRWIMDDLRSTAPHSFFMDLAQMVDVSGTLGAHDQILCVLREDQQETIPPTDIWTAVGDRLREAMALHACEASDPLRDHGEP